MIEFVLSLFCYYYHYYYICILYLYIVKKYKYSKDGRYNKKNMVYPAHTHKCCVTRVTGVLHKIAQLPVQ